MNAPIPELLLFVFITFIVFPVAVAIWDEYRWLRFSKHKLRRHEQLLTPKKRG